MVEVLLDKSPAWLAANGPEAALVLRTRGSLARNLSDFPFPSHCSEDEKRSVEERLLAALESANLLSMGQYCSLQGLDAREIGLLHERQLITDTLIRGTGPRGVFVSHDQSLTILVNDEDHVRIQVTAPGLQTQEVWSRLSGIDDLLDVSLDYAFDERLGYLSSDLARVGTGLRIDVMLHLPALGMANGILPAEQYVREQQHTLFGAFGSLTDGHGDLYVIQNLRTLGRSEEEIAFHVKHLAMELIAREKDARNAVLNENAVAVEDRVGRALGIARNARLLDHGEALDLLSSLRFGLEAGVAERFTYPQLNQLFMAGQRAHIEMKEAQDLDELALSQKRADLFRGRFA